MDYQIHFEKKFYKDHKTGYWISTTKQKIRAHRWVWENINGKIPKGYHIHHKDGDKSNNDIKNLMMLSAFEHISYHARQEKNVSRAKEWMEEIRPLTKAWHASDEGKAWHRYHALKCKFGNNDPIEYLCENCGTKFHSKKLSRTKFCSNACKSARRRLLGLDNIETECCICKSLFTKNKYSKCLTCSRTCAAELQWKRRSSKKNG